MDRDAEAANVDADGRVRAGGRARRRGNDDARHLSVASGVRLPRVTLFHAAGCHLCERARDVVAAVRADTPFELEEIDITGDVELERRYREWLPVVEIDGERAFVFYVQPDALRRKLGAR